VRKLRGRRARPHIPAWGLSESDRTQAPSHRGQPPVTRLRPARSQKTGPPKAEPQPSLFRKKHRLPKPLDPTGAKSLLVLPSVHTSIYLYSLAGTHMEAGTLLPGAELAGQLLYSYLSSLAGPHLEAGTLLPGAELAGQLPSAGRGRSPRSHRRRGAAAAGVRGRRHLAKQVPGRLLRPLVRAQRPAPPGKAPRRALQKTKTCHPPPLSVSKPPRRGRVQRLSVPRHWLLEMRREPPQPRSRL
jgi:hypothetical protein